MEALLERIAVALEKIAKQGGFNNANRGGKPKHTPPTGEEKGFQVEISSLGSMWRNGTGMFYNGTTTYEGREWNCSVGVADKLKVKFEPGDTVLVTGIPEKKSYKGEETLMFFANTADIVVGDEQLKPTPSRKKQEEDDFPF